MTAALAALALSAIYLTAGGSIVGRLYERERTFRYAADAALALGKARLQTDTLFSLPDTGVLKLMNGEQITDARGDTIAGVLMDLYAGTTGDTTGRYGTFVTLVARAYDAGGTRHVRRLDLTRESFSRYAIFTNTFPSSQTLLQPGGPTLAATMAFRGQETVRGRAHSNQNWRSCCGTPVYFDTVTMAGRRVDTLVTTWWTLGSQTNPDFKIAPRESVPVIPFPTVAKLAALPNYATTGNMRFTVTLTKGPMARSGTVNLSGKWAYFEDAAFWQPGSDSVAVSGGTRLEFYTVDLDNSGTLEEREGFFRVFRAAAGIDTIRVKAGDRPPRTATGIMMIEGSHPVLQQQCGVMATINGRDEFFPIQSLQQQWVRARLRSSTNPTFSDVDTSTLRKSGAWVGYWFAPQLRYGGINVFLRKPRARCYPVGAPQLMLTERITQRGTCAPIGTATIPTDAMAWGADSTCTAANRYGGQDTTFTPVVHNCFMSDSASGQWMGRCTDSTSRQTATPVLLGQWVAAPSTIVAPAGSWATGGRLEVERPFAWAMAKPYNLNSKGVIYVQADSGVLYLSGTMRGKTTLYTSGRIGLIDDLTYDQDPTAPNALCRNFLGLIAGGDIMVADNFINMMQFLPEGHGKILGTEDYYLHGIALSLNGTVGAEGWEVGNFGPRCPKGNYTGVWYGDSLLTSGGCFNHTGGSIMQRISLFQYTFFVGLRDNKTVDPCQLTNARPPYFPMTNRYLENKYLELDPQTIRSDSTVRALILKLKSG